MTSQFARRQMPVHWLNPHRLIAAGEVVWMVDGVHPVAARLDVLSSTWTLRGVAHDRRPHDGWLFPPRVAADGRPSSSE